jgi:hypothetical protein
MTQLAIVAFSIMLLGWSQQISFLPAIFLLSFATFKLYRVIQPTGIFKRLLIGVPLITIFYLSLNLLTLDLRLAGNRFHATGLNSISSGQAFTAYFATVGMGVGGFLIGAPYAAMENLRLLVPNSGELTIRDDFPTKSKKVREFIKEAKRSSIEKVKKPLIWSSYCQDNCDVAFALNGGNLTIEIKRGQCIATASASVSYKPQYRSSTLASLPFMKLRIDQAAIHAVQELGYLFPYDIHYEWVC